MKLQLEVYQWLGPIIAGYFIIRTFRQYRVGKYSPRNTIIWIGFWLGILLLSLLPDRIPNIIAKGLGFKDHINAIIFAALALLFLMMFYLSAAVNRIEDRLTDLVRKIALDTSLTSPTKPPVIVSNQTNYTEKRPKNKSRRSNSRTSSKTRRRSKRLSKS